VSVKEILEAIRVLSPEERAQVRALLDTSPDATLSPKEGVQTRLRAAELLGKTVRRPATGRTRHTPVEIKGRPLSWTIVDERR
jgi:hypothetical protein